MPKTAPTTEGLKLVPMRARLKQKCQFCGADL
jgi:hypothetical protein